MILPLRSAFLTLGVAALVAGCGRSTPPADTAAAAPAKAASAVPVRLQIFGDPAEIAAYRELIAAYEQTHAGKKVELIPVGKQSDHMAKLSTAFAAGNPPDLFILNFRRFGQFAGRGALAPLGETMAKEGRFKPEEFYPQPVEAFNFQGTQYCLPQNVSSLVVYYNRQLFKNAGVAEPKDDWRFADLLAAAQKLRADTDKDGKTISGARVDWDVGVGSGTALPTRSTGDARGIATTVWTLGATAGTARLSAQVNGVTPVVFTATVIAGPPALLVASPEAAYLNVGDTVRVRGSLRDQYGNTVTTDNATQVAVAITSGTGGTLGGVQTATATGGVATFSGVTLAGTVGQNYVLRFSSTPTLTVADSSNVTVSAGAATTIAVNGGKTCW